MVVVIDCNIFVMCLTSASPYHAIFQSLIRGNIQLVVTADIMLEYEEVVQRKYSLATAQTFITLLSELPNVRFVNPSYKWQLITADPDDNKYCDCAITGQALYLVTEDRHFNVLKDIFFPSLTAISIDQFLEVVKSL